MELNAAGECRYIYFYFKKKKHDIVSQDNRRCRFMMMKKEKIFFNRFYIPIINYKLVYAMC